MCSDGDIRDMGEVNKGRVNCKGKKGGQGCHSSSHAIFSQSNYIKYICTHIYIVRERRLTQLWYEFTVCKPTVRKWGGGEALVVRRGRSVV